MTFFVVSVVYRNGHVNPTYRSHERTTYGRYRNPVECEQTHSEAADRTKEVVHDDIIRSDPTHPIEHAKSGP